MKKLLTKSLILVFGLGVVASFTACHTGGDGSAQVTTSIAPSHSISGTILTADGTPLAGATVTIDGKAVTVNGNAFAEEGLKAGNHEVVVTCTGYKSVTKTVSLEIIDGKYGTNAQEAFYLAKEQKSTEKTLLDNTVGAGDEITLETTLVKGDDNQKVSQTDETAEKITVVAETETLTATDPEYSAIDTQIKAQSGNTEDITNFVVYLTNITSLEDAKALANKHHVTASSRMTRSGIDMPDNYTLLAGVGVNVGKDPKNYNIDLGSKTFTITLKMPNDVIGAVGLFRYVNGENWEAIDKSNLPSDIKSITPVEGGIKIVLSKVRPQSFGFGVKVKLDSNGTPAEEQISAKPFENGTSPVTLSEYPYSYQVKTGVKVESYEKTALNDFLLKMVTRMYGTQVSTSIKTVDKTYKFSTPYTVHANGVLYLEGKQYVSGVTYIIEGTSAEIKTTEYGDALMAPYEVWNEIDEIIVHGGGSN